MGRGEEEKEMRLRLRAMVRADEQLPEVRQQRARPAVVESHEEAGREGGESDEDLGPAPAAGETTVSWWPAVGAFFPREDDDAEERQG